MKAAGKLKVNSAILDGEAVVFNDAGVPDFHALRSEFGRAEASRIAFMAFDLLHLDGEDLRGKPLIERKDLLRQLLDKGSHELRYAEHVPDEEIDATTIFEHACRMGLEGIVSKKADAPYRSGDRAATWLKRKCRNSDTFPVVAFVDKLGANPRRIASLYIGRHEDGGVSYAGKVETGFRSDDRVQLREALDPYVRKVSPLAEPIRKPKATWVRPEVEVEVEFTGITENGTLRAAVFKGLREAPDRPEEAGHRSRTAGPSSRRARPENILQLLPDAVNPSKDELRDSWTKVAERALAHLGRRPLKLVRYVQGKTFYHKGPLPPVPDSVHKLRLEKREGGTGVRVWVDDLDGLLGLVDMDAVELHAWGATVDDVEHADMLVFDLDPGRGIDYEAVRETAIELRDMLEYEQGLTSWPKLSGGKGIHVMVPLERKMPWQQAHDYSRRIAEAMAATAPSLYTTSASMSERPGRLFIDWLRNGRGTTAIAAWSPRARPGFPVAAPVSWQEVEEGLRPDAISITNFP